MSSSNTERSNFRGNRPLSSNPPHSICLTDRKVVSFTHLWTIDHFQSYLDDPQSPRVLFSSYFSPTFGPHTDTSWCLKLYPKGVNEKSVEYISLFVKYVRGRTDLLAKAEFSLINSRGEFHIVRKTPYHVFPTGGDWGYSEYLMRMVLTTQRKSELLNSDQSLKIFARVIIVGESSSSIIHEEKKNTYDSLVSLSTHFNSLLSTNKDNCYDVTIIVRPEQFNNLIYDNKSNDIPSSSSSPKKTNNRTKRKRYSSNSGGSSGAGESSDETTSTISAISSISTTTTTFYAHRSILSARSPVFAAMFSHSMLEDQNSTIEITDLQAETVRCLLEYIYTSNVEEINEHNAIEIFKAADKYELEFLKQKAELIMINSLSISNCTMLFIVADLHNAIELKKRILNFIMRNIIEIIETDDWRLLVEQHPVLATEAFVYSAEHAASCACSL
ncbi:unnamed protein product [Rotaria sp. Silwood1]|nr:unnamed protein product [Rotaria sp. Silwood1]CAF1630063.1 unnamed protein product [Rotaria sp. Silwood1]CAF1631179.1 unnamed protein product [Rotaria sp. Silwood1]CAF3798147.1 unnamed protein product [Rotaria sp. Silwood1]CAF3818704.1 unnamed protein product [Rotaria sp. Silwood1]